MDDRLIVTASPHIRDNATTRGLMGNVLIALVPSIVASGLIFGMRAILLTAVTTLACVVFEYLYCKLMHKPNPVGDLSACVTGVILVCYVVCRAHKTLYPIMLHLSWVIFSAQ